MNKEMEEEIIKLKPDEAIELLKDGDKIHCFIDMGFALTGADWDRESVIEEIKKAEEIQVGGDNCQSMGHGIVVYPKGAEKQSELRFFEHDEDKMKDKIIED